MEISTEKLIEKIEDPTTAASAFDEALRRIKVIENLKNSK